MKDKTLYYRMGTELPAIYRSGDVFFMNPELVEYFQIAFQILDWAAFDVFSLDYNGNIDHKVSLTVYQEGSTYYTKIYNEDGYTNKQRTYV